MRAFVAFELPDRFIDDAVQLARQLSAAVPGRFMPAENYHITIAFLGDIGEDDARRAIGALDEACSDLGPIPCAATGLGKFGRASDATLWLGIAQAPALMEAAACLRGRLRDYGLSFDDKPFAPHVTLARRARIPRSGLDGLVFPEHCELTRVTLFKSTLDQTGATYKALYTVELDR